MRARLIKPGFFKSDELAALPPLGRILFAGLWCLADRCGRLHDRPRMIKAEVLPYDDCDCNALLDGLARGGFIVRYGTGRDRHIQVVNFHKHQTPHVKEPESQIPASDKEPTSLIQASDKSETSIGQDPPVPMIPVPTIPDPVPAPLPPTPVVAEQDEARASESVRLRAVPKPKEIEQADTQQHPLYEPLVAVFGRPPARELPAWRDDLAALDEMGALPEDIPRAAAGYERTFGTDNGRQIAMTRPALVRHWYRALHAAEQVSRVTIDGRMPIYGELDPAKYTGDGIYARQQRPWDDDIPLEDLEREMVNRSNSQRHEATP